MRVTLAGSPAKFRDQLEELLSKQGFEVPVLAEPARMLDSLRAHLPQLLVIVKPFFDEGFAAFVTGLRADARLKTLPILCVAPAAGVELAVRSLDEGADDFIYRPFNPQIFLARVRTLLRRSPQPAEAEEEAVTVIHAGAFVIKLLSRQAAVGERTLMLTRLEFDLLAFLARRADQVFKREELLAAVWNYPGNVETRTLDKHVESLRRKLAEHAACIETVHGVGYRFLPAPRKASLR